MPLVGIDRPRAPTAAVYLSFGETDDRPSPPTAPDRAAPCPYDQCQGQLWIAEREWLDLAIYWPDLPIMITRTPRDESFITEFSAAVATFNDELDRSVTQVAAYGQMEAA